MTCTHDRYKQGGYLTSTNALKAMKMKRSDICWMGMIIKECKDCGEDISYAEVVQVKTVEQYLSDNRK